MTKITLTNLVDLQNETTAVNAINNNSSIIVTAMDNTISRDGTAPNQMLVPLDMNSNQVVNLPAPATPNSPLRLQDVATLNGGGTIASMPSGGTTGQHLIKRSNVSYDTQWQTPGTGSVTSVGLSLPADFTVTGSPVTTSGTLSASFATTPTGTGALVKAISPTMTTPTLGVATATTVNGNAITTGTGTLTLGTNTLTVSDTGTAVTSGTTIGGDLTGNFPNPTIQAGAITNAKLANSSANTFKGNPATGASVPSDFTIGSLTNKAAPGINDLLVIQDQAAGGALKNVTVSSISAGGAVGSVNGLSGTLTIATAGGNVSASGSTITHITAGGDRNKFRNGTFDIWQRGSSGTTITTAGAYLADGWIVLPTGASVTADRQNSDLSLSYYSLRVTGAASVTDVIVKQRIEGFMAAPLVGQNVTVQAKIFNNTGGSITPTLTVKRANAQDNWGATTTDVNAVSLQVCPNAAWTLVAYTFAANASSYNGLEVAFDFGNNFSTTGKSIQICQCDISATPNLSTGLQTTPPIAEMRPIGIELPLCQRYFQQTTSTTLNNAYASAWAFSTTVVFGYYQFPIMRTTPTGAASAGSTFQALLTAASFNATAISITAYGPSTALIQLTVSGATAGTPGIIRDAGSNNSLFSLSAEL